MKQGLKKSLLGLCGIFAFVGIFFFTSQKLDAATHTHSYTRVISSTSSTCTSRGTTVKACSCGARTTVYSNALGHILSTSKTDATCTSAGKTVTRCVRSGCSYSSTTTIPAKGHSLSTSKTDATCTSAGKTVTKCTRSGCSYSSTTTTPAKGHSFTVKKSEVKATCTSTGSITYKCSRCTATQTSITAKVAHNYSGTSTVNPTCTASGTIYGVCSCGAKKVNSTIPALGHSFTVKKSEIKATCTSTGSITYKCSRCTSTKTTIVEAPGHQLSTTTTKQPTCKATGTSVTKCTRSGCGYSYTSTLAIIAHNQNSSRRVEATCTNEGAVWLTCSMCGKDMVKASTISKKAHSYNSTTLKCSMCGKTRCEIEGHKYDSVRTVNPTCTKDGTVYGVCKCGVERVNSTIPKLGHRFDELVKDTDSTCKVHGELIYKCSHTGCKETQTSIYPLIDHDQMGKTVTHKPTCQVEGSIWLTCSMCGKEMVKASSLSIIAHDYDKETLECSMCHKTRCEIEGHKYDSVRTESPTCEKDGTIYGVCKCGSERVNSTIPKLGHRFSDIITDEEANCQKAGKLVIKCSHTGCEEQQTTIRPKKEHDQTGKTHTYPATCQKEGSIWLTCSMCGKDMVMASTISKTAHDTYTAWEDHCLEPCVEVTLCHNCDYRKETGRTRNGLGHYFTNGECIRCGVLEEDVTGYECNNAIFTTQNGVTSCNLICQTCQKPLYKHGIISLRKADVDSTKPFTQYNDREDIFLRIAHSDLSEGVDPVNSYANLTCNVCGLSKSIVGWEEKDFDFVAPADKEFEIATATILSHQLWYKTTILEKYAILRDVLIVLSDRLQINNVPGVAIGDLGNRRIAQYEPTDNLIRFHYEYLTDENNPRDVRLQDVGHELMHTRQREHSENPITFLDYLYELDSRYYISPEVDDAAYRSQIKEVEANAFAHVLPKAK